ncbi:hypothetical protein ACQRBV_24170 [Pseudomonas sp. R11F]|uniref:hypothetical protein n=1 Tax=Pseudomonas TaxID=286 RepID=UPI00398F0983
MAHSDRSSPATLPRKTPPPVEGSGSNLLTLDNAGPVQMGFWVPNRIWATANYLVPLRNYIAAMKKPAPWRPCSRNWWPSSNG